MGTQRLHIKRFDGGLSDDETLGPNNSASLSESMDHRTSSNMLRLNKQLAKESAAIITTEVTDAVRIPAGGGTVYMAGRTRIYRRTPGNNGAAGTYTVAGSGNAIINTSNAHAPSIASTFGSGAGVLSGECMDLLYLASQDALMYVCQTAIHQIDAVSSGGGIYYGRYAAYPVNSTYLNTGGSYPLPSSINEAQKWSFTLAAEPITSLQFQVFTGFNVSGQWTATLHDGANNAVATSTSTNVPTNGSYISFAFAIRGKIGQSYHVHLTCPTTGHAVLTNSDNQLASANGFVFAQRLISNTYGHRLLQLGAKYYICNERYLAEWEVLDTSVGSVSGYNAHRLIFPEDVRTNGLAIYSEYLAISTAVDDGTDGTQGRPARGMIFFWDTVSQFYNFALPVNEGVPNSLCAIGNVLYWEAEGRLYRWAGGDTELVYEFPGINEFTPAANGPQAELYLSAAREAMDVRGSILQVGFPRTTANTNVKIGLYSYGHTKGTTPLSVAHESKISTGNQTVQLNTATTPSTPVTGITLVKNFGNNLLVAWKDYVAGSVVYGVDLINDASAMATSGSWASLWFDNGEPDKEKTPMAMKIVFKEPLPAGVTVTPRIRYDAGSWQVDPTPATTGAVDVVYNLDQSDRFYEATFGFTITNPSGNRPKIRSITFKFDDNHDEDGDTEVSRTND